MVLTGRERVDWPRHRAVTFSEVFFTCGVDRSLSLTR